MPRARTSSDASRVSASLADLLNLLGHRWLARVVAELDGGPVGFRALQARCGGISPTVLSARLTELRAAGLVEQGPAGAYNLTRQGEKLAERITGLSDVASGWSAARKRAAARKG